MKTTPSILLVTGISLVLCTGCTSVSPVIQVGSSQAPESSSNLIRIPDTLSYDDAWQAVFDTLAIQFELNVASKETGYLRTTWANSTTENSDESQVMRTIVRFESGRRALEVRAERRKFNALTSASEGIWEMEVDQASSLALRNRIIDRFRQIQSQE